jgi:hypothetical protein
MGQFGEKTHATRTAPPCVTTGWSDGAVVAAYATLLPTIPRGTPAIGKQAIDTTDHQGMPRRVPATAAELVVFVIR